MAVMALAQPAAGPPSRDIAKLLKSKQPSDLAWGATLAAESGDKKYLPALIRLLDRKLRTADDRKLPPYVLDALIRFDAEVPAKTIEPLAKDYFYSVVNLVRKHPDRHLSMLTRLFDQASDPYRRLAAARILDRNPTASYVSAALRQKTIEATLWIADPSPAGMMREFGLSTGNFAELFGPMCCAVVNRTGKFPVLPESSYCDRPAYSAFSTLWELPNVPLPSKQIQALSPEQISEAMKTLQSDVERYVDQLRASFIQRGLLSPNDPVRPRIEVKVSDQRTVKLPEIPRPLP
jgi:hypothetical protein